MFDGLANIIESFLYTYPMESHKSTLAITNLLQSYECQTAHIYSLPLLL